MGKFCQFLTELSAHNTSVFNNLSKSQWIFTKFDMCIDIVEIRFGVAHWQISSIFDRVICQQHDKGRILSFYILFTSSCQCSLLFLYVMNIYTSLVSKTGIKCAEVHLIVWFCLTSYH